MIYDGIEYEKIVKIITESSYVKNLDVNRNHRRIYQVKLLLTVLAIFQEKSVDVNFIPISESDNIEVYNQKFKASTLIGFILIIKSMIADEGNLTSKLYNLLDGCTTRSTISSNTESIENACKLYQFYCHENGNYNRPLVDKAPFTVQTRLAKDSFAEDYNEFIAAARRLSTEQRTKWFDSFAKASKSTELLVSIISLKPYTVPPYEELTAAMPLIPAIEVDTRLNPNRKMQLTLLATAASVLNGFNESQYQQLGIKNASAGFKSNVFAGLMLHVKTRIEIEYQSGLSAFFNTNPKSSINYTTIKNVLGPMDDTSKVACLEDAWKFFRFIYESSSDSVIREKTKFEKIENFIFKEVIDSILDLKHKSELILAAQLIKNSEKSSSVYNSNTPAAAPGV